MDLIAGIDLAAQDAQQKLEQAAEPVLLLIRGNRQIVADCQQLVRQLPDANSINRGFAMDLMTKLAAQGLVPMDAVQQFVIDPIRSEEELSRDDLIDLAALLQGLATGAPAPAADNGGNTAPTGATGTTTAAPPPTTPTVIQNPPVLTPDDVEAAALLHVGGNATIDVPPAPNNLANGTAISVVRCREENGRTLRDIMVNAEDGTIVNDTIVNRPAKLRSKGLKKALDRELAGLNYTIDNTLSGHEVDGTPNATVTVTVDGEAGPRDIVINMEDGTIIPPPAPTPLSTDELKDAVVAYVASKDAAAIVTFVGDPAPDSKSGGLTTLVSFKLSDGIVIVAEVDSFTGAIGSVNARRLSDNAIDDILATAAKSAIMVLARGESQDSRTRIAIASVRYHTQDNKTPVHVATIDTNTGTILTNNIYNRPATITNEKAIEVVVADLNVYEPVQIRVIGVTHNNNGDPVVTVRYRVGRRNLGEAKVHGESGKVIKLIAPAAVTDDPDLPMPPTWWERNGGKLSMAVVMAILCSLLGWQIAVVKTTQAGISIAGGVYALILIVIATRSGRKANNTPAAAGSTP
ncbi:hypothetical protein HY523_02440 [Candidatus Berkelbacteria bacterium]|nr:hypothetical protein [Candidatus Berkelbacteria bacterium]